MPRLPSKFRHMSRRYARARNDCGMKPPTGKKRVNDLAHGLSTHRSEQSLAFEDFWRRLPKQGLLPHRRDFNPAKAASLLRHLMLAEVRLLPSPSFKIRLVGGAIQERVQRTITGTDYLEFLPQEYRAGAVETARLMFDRPCGIWQISPFHYERGLAENNEITAFPLVGEGMNLALGLVIARPDFVRPISAGDKVMRVDTATLFEFLDVGAGAPAWPQ